MGRKDGTLESRLRTTLGEDEGSYRIILDSLNEANRVSPCVQHAKTYLVTYERATNVDIGFITS